MICEKLYKNLILKKVIKKTAGNWRYHDPMAWQYEIYRSYLEL